MQALSGDRLACLPLELRLRGKSTRQSHGTPIFYVDLTLRSGIDMEEALQQARQLDQARQEAGFNQQALDAAAQQGLVNGAFEDSEEDASAIVEEFYPEGEATAAATISQLNPTKPSLAEKLDAKAARQTSLTDQGGRHAPTQGTSTDLA